MTPAVRRRQFTVEKYRRMGETGILADDPRIELIAGTIVVREPTCSRHAGTVDRLGHLFFERLARRAVVRIQNPASFPDQMSELQPDLTLLRSRTDFYSSAHPGRGRRPAAHRGGRLHPTARSAGEDPAVRSGGNRRGLAARSH